MGDRFVVLAISVVSRGCAMPVAWVVLEAGKKKAWRREWLRMLRQLRAAGPHGSPLSCPLTSLGPEVGTQWSGRGTAFKGRVWQLECTLLARWDAGHKDPWLLLTDLPPEASDVCWYGLRAWIERGIKITKREG